MHLITKYFKATSLFKLKQSLLASASCLLSCCSHFPQFLFDHKMMLKKAVTFTRIKMAVLFWIFLDHICLKWIKHDQTCSIGFLTNQKTFLYKIVAFKIRIKIAILFWIRLDQICPKWTLSVEP